MYSVLFLFLCSTCLKIGYFAWLTYNLLKLNLELTKVYILNRSSNNIFAYHFQKKGYLRSIDLFSTD